MNEAKAHTMHGSVLAFNRLWMIPALLFPTVR
jgi:hypothetical protein